MTNNQASAERDVAERLILALEPFNLLATGVNMNDPLSKWFTMAQFQAARDAIEAALSAPARDGEGLPHNTVVSLANRYEGAAPETLVEITVRDLRVAAMAVGRATFERMSALASNQEQN